MNRSTSMLGTLGLMVLLAACGGSASSNTPADPPQAGGSGGTAFANCSFDTAVRDAKGVARLALVVGVGAYRHDTIRKLSGPPHDAVTMQALLNGPGGYGFPEKNVCVLVDEAATGNNFRTAFENGLVKRAKKGDVVVIFFAGHGTQLPDTNHDESDLSDEVLMFVDSRTPSANDLRDDEFGALLTPLRKTVGNVVVILDACNSGSGTRDASANLVARTTPPRPEDLSVVETTPAPPGAASAVVFLDAADGLTTISAAVDGSVAVEKDGAGIFTNALVSVLSQVGAQPLTYEQLEYKLRPAIAATSTQIPSIEGKLDREVFGVSERTRPMGLIVQSVGPPVKLGGTLLPGVGRNAELRVFDRGLKGTEFSDPAKSKAMLVVASTSGANVEAKVTSQRPGAGPIAPGDVAVLVRPSDDWLALKARIRPANEPNGVPADRAAKLRQALAANSEAAMLVKVSDTLSDFEVTVDAKGRYNIIGPEGRVRNVMGKEESVAENLWLHARQRAFLNLRAEGGSEYTEDNSLIVNLVDSGKPPSPCVRSGAGIAKDKKGTFVVPLCYSYQIEVKAHPDMKGELQIGGLILSSDGSVFGFPPKGNIPKVRAGGAPGKFQKVFLGGPPLRVDDYLLVFGMKPQNWVDWEALSATAATRDASVPQPGEQKTGPLHRALDRYIRAAGTRGVIEDNQSFEDTTWTRTVVKMRTEANPAFEADLAAVGPGTREYTIKKFDIKPYLPDDPNSALHRVLTKADSLAQRDLPYKQHGWSPDDPAHDPENLVKGIDCSRSIWYAFTRSGLKYNSSDAYMATVDMVKPTSRLNEQFERCPLGQDYETGDVLVYRDEQQGDGHVVMVIDNEKRIAWGSHGWDGNAKEFKVEPDTGVEYQLIKHKQDWNRWDRKTMDLVACWRYKGFRAERAAGLGLPGMDALGTRPCKEGCQ